MKKKSISFDPENIENIDKDILMRESDRGCVLILTSDIENKLGELIQLWFLRIGAMTKAEQKNVFDYTGPLGTFSAKISLLKLIGLIDKVIYDDLQLLRKVRNVAAHTSEGFSLSDGKIKKLIQSMKISEPRIKTIKRYTLGDSALEETKVDLLNENVTKGFGLVRFDKVNFILNINNLLLEIGIIEKSLLSLLPTIEKTMEAVQRMRKLVSEKLKRKN